MSVSGSFSWLERKTYFAEMIPPVMASFWREILRLATLVSSGVISGRGLAAACVTSLTMSSKRTVRAGGAD